MTHTYKHKQTTISRTSLDVRSAQFRDHYLTTHNAHNRQTSMPAVGLETAIPASERPQTNALDRAATEIGFKSLTYYASENRKFGTFGRPALKHTLLRYSFNKATRIHCKELSQTSENVQRHQERDWRRRIYLVNQIHFRQWTDLIYIYIYICVCVCVCVYSFHVSLPPY